MSVRVHPIDIRAQPPPAGEGYLVEDPVVRADFRRRFIILGTGITTFVAAAIAHDALKENDSQLAYKILGIGVSSLFATFPPAVIRRENHPTTISTVKRVALGMFCTVGSGIANICTPNLLVGSVVQLCTSLGGIFISIYPNEV